MDASSATGALHRPGRGRVFESIVDAIGDTPIVRLRKLPQMHGVSATILAKLEYFNPAASVKDRIGAAMIIAMEKAGVTKVVELGPGVQHVTVDLGATHEVFAVLFWHFHKTPRVYFDVLVQLADDAGFKQNVRTVFNNDHDNTSGLGAGKDMNFVETSEGKLVDAKGARARFVRIYSKGNNANELNHYVEVEVFGRPAK